MVSSKNLKSGEITKRYLGFFLHVENELDGQNVNWQCKTSFVLKLKNQIKMEYTFKKYDYTFSGKKDKFFGLNSFITVDDLFDLEKGFIKNNSISLEIDLQADKVIRDY